MDKGCHDNALLADCAARSVRTYVPERRQKTLRWTDKPAEQETAFRANRRRVRTAKGRRLNRWRSERCERTFAHVCETGGGRRRWLRGLENVSKHHTLKCAAYNLGLLLRTVWGFCKPRNPRNGAGAPFSAFCVLLAVITCLAGWNADPLTRLYLFLGLLVVTPSGGLPEQPIFQNAGKPHFVNGLLAGNRNDSISRFA